MMLFLSGPLKVGRLSQSLFYEQSNFLIALPPLFSGNVSKHNLFSEE
jgi:hypothetical protein